MQGIGFKPDVSLLLKYNNDTAKRAFNNGENRVLKNNAVVLSDENIAVVKWLYHNTPMKQHHIRRMFGISKQGVNCIVNGTRRIDVEQATENQIDRFFKSRDYTC